MSNRGEAGFPAARGFRRAVRRRARLLPLGLALLGLSASAAPAAAPPFTDITVAAGLADPGAERGVAWGDYDGDGRPDIFIAVLDGPDRLYRNLGDGRFAEVPGPMNDPAGRSACGAWGDWDGDGDLDLFVGRVGPNALYRQDPDGFTDVRAAAGLSDTLVTWGAAWSDFDGDGRLDLAVINFGLLPNSLYRNLGDGRFADVAAALGVDDEGHGATGAWGDWDGDGDLDLFVANKDGADRLFRNEAGAGFTDVTAAAGMLEEGDSTGAVWGDADGDGDLDLFVARNLSADRLFLNNGDGTFVEGAAAAGLAFAGASRGGGWGDCDNDGDLDLFLAVSEQPSRLYLNLGDGRFEEDGAAAGVAEVPGASAAWADLDGDGDLDLLQGNFGGHLRCFENRLETGAGWLAVDLRGAGANTRAVGATVRVFAGGRVLLRQQTMGGGGYQSQAPSRLHFGLGAAPVDSLAVTWPDGSVTKQGPTPGGRTLRLVQPRD